MWRSDINDWIPTLDEFKAVISTDQDVREEFFLDSLSLEDEPLETPPRTSPTATQRHIPPQREPQTSHELTFLKKSLSSQTFFGPDKCAPLGKGWYSEALSSTVSVFF